MGGRIEEVSAAMVVTRQEIDAAKTDAALIALVNDKAELLRRSVLIHMKEIGALGTIDPDRNEVDVT